MIVNVGRYGVWKENASVLSEYSAGIVIGTFLASKIEPQRLLPSFFKPSLHILLTEKFHLLGCLQPSKFLRRKPYVCTAEGEKPC